MGLGRLAYSCADNTNQPKITYLLLQERLASEEKTNPAQLSNQLSRLTTSSRFISRSSIHSVHPSKSTKLPNPNLFSLERCTLKSLSIGLKIL